MTEPTYSYSFEEGCAEVKERLGDRNLETAYNVASWLARQYRDKAEAHFLHHLVVCLSNLGGGARYSSHIIDDARACPDVTDSLLGDMLRDQALGLIRYNRPGSGNLDRAYSVIMNARESHAHDSNRMACLMSAEGRLMFALREYPEAAASHQKANDQWAALGDEADPVWVYNNLIHWLKAVVAVHGSFSPQARQLLRRITNNQPEGVNDRSREAYVIIMPLVGNRIHTWLQRHRR